MSLDITQQIVDDFRSYYPEFSDTNTWADATLTRYLEEAVQETNANRWGNYQASPANLRARGMYAYAAHKAALGRMREQALNAGQTPTAAVQANSKTVGDESIGYAVATPDANQMQSMGDLNTTLYGQEFLRLRTRAGTGAATTGSYWQQ